jgi:hypothetical protein
MFIKENSKYYISGETNVETFENLPSKLFSLHSQDGRGFFLLEEPSPNIPNKIYGDSEQLAERYINTFKNNSGKNLGVLLSGVKGAGKTVLSKLISLKSNMPTIFITRMFSMQDLQFVFGRIEQECVIIFDEFEKVYKDELQNELLTILDGVAGSKKLFVLISNSHNISEFILNRPGRIHYHKSFTGLSDDEVDEIVEDKLEAEDQKEVLKLACQAIGNISIDVLSSIIFEMNLYKCSVIEALKMLNVTTEQSWWKVIMIVKGKRVETTFYGHPLMQKEFYLVYNSKESMWRYEEHKVVVAQMNVNVSDNTIRMEKDDDSIIFKPLTQENNLQIEKILE